MPSCSVVEALYPQLAEVALHSDDQQSFRETWLGRVSAVFGLDSATVSSTVDGRQFESLTLNAQLRAEDLTEYVAELRTHEVEILFAKRVLMDDALFPAERRDKLRVYRDFLAPQGMVREAMLGWIGRGRAFMSFLGKRRGTKAFEAEDLRRLELVLPVIAIGEALHAARKPIASQRATSILDQVTKAERSVVGLAQRGLTNIEISQITGTSPSTVRNQLASAFCKLGVRNRTQLSFLLSGIEDDLGAIRRAPATDLERLLVRHAATNAASEADAALSRPKD